MMKKYVERFTLLQWLFIVLYAATTAIGPFTGNLGYGTIVLLTTVCVGAVAVEILRGAYEFLRAPFESVSPGLMSANKWASAGIIACIFLIQHKMYYVNSSLFELREGVTIIHDMTYLATTGIILALAIFGLSAIAKLPYWYNGKPSDSP